MIPHIIRDLTAALQDVTTRRKDAQAALLKALAAANVVLVGHALNHDLNALRLDYQPVIDTSMLFSYRQGSRMMANFHLSASDLGYDIGGEL